MQARATDGVKKVIETLSGYLKNFEPGKPEFNAIISAIKALNPIFKTATPAQPEVKPPIPVPGTPPGAGLGGLPPQAAAAAMPPGGGGPSGEAPQL
jgi:hypothetical protein